MIASIPDLPGNVLGFEASGKVTGKDYETVLIPAVEEKLKAFSKIRLLYYLGSDFSGYELEAMWDDAKIGLKHLAAWERIAIVTDTEWIRSATRIFGFAMPGHVRVFKNDGFSAAKKWLSE
ncbi:MAG: STAS/SEC14 domain-containing protein [Verrucomicrobia bacterium]|nr:MAG: STAS/SEC14 domain-containing protein [Verrucomicrobiota bacterium]